MNKAYSRINWQNKPSTQTPIDADNLNRMDLALDTIDDRVIALDTGESGLNTRLTTAEGNITSLQNGKVDKITGKGLSTNDYTTAEKTKLAGISTQANKTTVTQVQTEGKEVAKIGIDGVDTSIYVEDIIDDDTISEDSTFSSSKIDEFTEEKTLEILDDLTDATTKIGNPILLTTKFGNVVKACSVDLFPKQDLHGYDSPWVGGGGANKFDEVWENGILDTTTGANVGGYNNVRSKNYIPCLPSTQYNFIAPSSYGMWTVFYDENKDIVTTDLPETPQMSNYARYINGVITTPNTAKYIRFYMVIGYGTTYGNDIAINYPSSNSSYAPYSNICPISGRTEASVKRTGKNMLPKGVNSTARGVVFTVQDDGEVIVTETATGTAFWGVQFTIPAGSYILSGCPSGGGSNTYLIDIRNSVGGTEISGISGDTGSGSQFTITEPLTAYLNIRIASGYSAPSGGLRISPMIRLATITDDTYESYQGETVTIQLGQTVYGGTPDVTNGKLTIDKKLYTYNGSETWTSEPATATGIPYFLCRNGISEWLYVLTTETIANAYFKSNAGKLHRYQWIDTGNYGLAIGYGLRVALENQNPNTMTVEQFKTWLSTNNIQLSAPLANPIEITLTAEQISLLKGNNTLTTDGDNINLSYQELPDINALFDYVQTLEARIKALEDE